MSGKPMVSRVEEILLPSSESEMLGEGNFSERYSMTPRAMSLAKTHLVWPASAAARAMVCSIQAES